MMLLIVVLALLSGTGCGMESPTAPLPPKTVALGQDFELAPGQTGVVEGSGLSVVFERVGSDSRCAVDVTCVWEGDAAVTVSATGAAGGPGRFDLHTTQQMGSRQAHYGDFTIALQTVAPQPRSKDPIAAKDYRVALRVTR